MNPAVPQGVHSARPLTPRTAVAAQTPISALRRPSLSTCADVRSAAWSYRRVMNPRSTAVPSPAIRIAALTAAALVATALPAAAAQTFHPDATGDVVLLGVVDDSVTPQPQWEPGDIRRIRVVHGAHRVRVRLGFHDVARRTDNSYWYRLRTPHRRFGLIGFTAQDAPRGEWFLLSGYSGDPRRCAGLRHHVDYANERVEVSIPRRCLGHPRRVRVGATATTWIDAKEQTRIDDAYSTNEVERFALGPWVRRC